MPIATTDIRHSHGMPPLAFHRAQLIRCLFDGLPRQAKSKILTAKHITNIENSDTGVNVSCNDGTSYDGSIVIGADGAHSLTRRIMHRITTSNFPDLDWDPAIPFKSEYSGSFCSRNTLRNLRIATDTHPMRWYTLQPILRSFLPASAKVWEICSLGGSMQA